MLTLMYITNKPQIAQIAQIAGVDRIWIDMEYIGKKERQGGLDTVQLHHTFDDIMRLRRVVTSSQLMVRINPIHGSTKEYCSTEEEIEKTLSSGADVIMLPYFRTAREVERFIRAVDGRAITMILLETVDAVTHMSEILSVSGIDEVHIGLNDLHLSYHMKFMFELLADGTVKRICEQIGRSGIKYGFGGIARIGFGLLPAEYIITEHYALGSTAAILSRGFCDANIAQNPHEIEGLFIDGIKNIRAKEKEVEKYSKQQFDDNHEVIRQRVNAITKMD